MLLVPRFSFAGLPRVRSLRELDLNFDAPGIPTIRCFCGTIRLIGACEINEKIPMVPSTPVTKLGCSWDDDLTDSLPARLSVGQRDYQHGGQYAHSVTMEKFADVSVDRVVVWHVRQSSDE